MNENGRGSLRGRPLQVLLVRLPVFAPVPRCIRDACALTASRRRSLRQRQRAFIVWEDDAALDQARPVDFNATPQDAGATSTALTEVTTGWNCSNRLDIGSPPFQKPGTCRARTLAEPAGAIKPERAVRPRAAGRLAHHCSWPGCAVKRSCALRVKRAAAA